MSAEARVTLPTFTGTHGRSSVEISFTGGKIKDGGYAMLYPGNVGEIEGAVLKVVQLDISDGAANPFNSASEGPRFRRKNGRHFWAPVIYDGVVDGVLIMQALNKEEIPGVPVVYGVFEPPRADFLALGSPLGGKVVVGMEHIEGMTLRERIDNSKFTFQEMITFLDQLAPIIDAVHRPSAKTGRDAVAHLDVKPENIIVDSGGQLYLVDFDLAMQVRDIPIQMPLFYRNNFVPVTPAYMAPECYLLAAKDAENDLTMPITTRADMFSVAVMALEVLTKKTVEELAKSRNIPFDNISIHFMDEVLYQYLQFDFQQDVRNALQEAGLSERVSAVFQQALAFNPGDRFASVREFAQTLRQAA